MIHAAGQGQSSGAVNQSSFEVKVVREDGMWLQMRSFTVACAVAREVRSLKPKHQVTSKLLRCRGHQGWILERGIAAGAGESGNLESRMLGSGNGTR